VKNSPAASDPMMERDSPHANTLKGIHAWALATITAGEGMLG